MLDRGKRHKWKYCQFLVNPPDSELSFESNLPLSFIFGNEGVVLYISGVIFDHKPFTKVSVARFTITNNENIPYQ